MLLCHVIAMLLPCYIARLFSILLAGPTISSLHVVVSIAIVMYLSVAREHGGVTAAACRVCVFFLWWHRRDGGLEITHCSGWGRRGLSCMPADQCNSGSSNRQQPHEQEHDEQQ